MDENEEVAADNQVSMMPTFVFSRNGGKLDEMAGADKDKLVQLVELYAAGGSPVEGVTKTVVTPGDASTYPKKGDKLTMHYTGKLKDNGCARCCPSPRRAIYLLRPISRAVCHTRCGRACVCISAARSSTARSTADSPSSSR